MKSPARIGIVVNPTSGHGRGAWVGDLIINAFKIIGASVEILTGDSFDSALENCRRSSQNIDALVVVGGDGMAHLGIQVAAGTTLPLGIIPVGSGNDFSSTLGFRDLAIPKTLRSQPNARARVSALIAATMLVAAIPTPTDCDALHVCFDSGQKVWVGGAVSAGIDAAVNARANRYRWPHGRLRYVRALLQEVAAARMFGYRVTTDDGWRWEHRGAIAVAANIRQIGGGIPLSPLSDPHDGQLDVVLAGSLSRARLFGILPKLARGKHLSDPAVHHKLVTAVRFEASDRGAPPPSIYGDGEYLGELPATIRVVPGALKLLVVPSSVASRTPQSQGSIDDRP